MATTVKIVNSGGVAYRRSAIFRDIDQSVRGPEGGATISGALVAGDVQFLQVQGRFLPLRAPNGTVLCEVQQGPTTSGVAHTNQQPQQSYGQQPQQSYAQQPQPSYSQQPQAAGGWQTLYDDHQRPYYCNPTTGVTQWEKPDQPPTATPVQTYHAAPIQPQATHAQQPLGGKEQRAQEAFQRFDTDRSGTVELNEFIGAMRCLGTNLSVADAQAVFCIVDGDGDGRITLPEFTQHWVMNY